MYTRHNYYMLIKKCNQENHESIQVSDEGSKDMVWSHAQYILDWYFKCLPEGWKRKEESGMSPQLKCRQVNKMDKDKTVFKVQK
jgi:hypothetical protein